MAEFTNRQKVILATLTSQANWISGSEISEMLGVCKKTLQNDIKAINRATREPLILTNNRLGYRLNPQVEIPEFEEQRVIAPRDRYSTPKAILILLLFETKHLHIEEIAEKLYLSRTSINVNLAQAKRIASRNRGAQLIVSARNGLWIDACEESKRLMCAKLMNEDLDYPAMLQMPQLAELPKLQNSIQTILPEILVRNHIIITGQAFQDFVRFISIGILRSQLGMRVDTVEPEKRTAVVVQELTNRIYAELGYMLDPAEQALIRTRSHELNLIIKQPSQDSESVRTIRAFEKNVLRATGLHLQFTGTLQRNLADHLKRMRRRIMAERNNVGHYTKELFASYPLEVHLVKTGLEPAMGLEIPDAELGYVVLYVAAAIQELRSKVDVLLVSNASASILYTTKHHLKQRNAEIIGKIEAVPQYVYEQDPAHYLQNYAVHLTTEPDLALESPDFLSISIFPTDRQLEFVRSVISNCYASRKKERQHAMEIAYPALQEFETAQALPKLLSLRAQGASIRSVGVNLLCVTQLKHSSVNTLRFLTLPEAVHYEGKNITMILYANYGGQGSILAFFDRVAQLLQENT